MHHAANLEYLDANYGGVLIVFDRLFGTLLMPPGWQPGTDSQTTEDLRRRYMGAPAHTIKPTGPIRT